MIDIGNLTQKHTCPDCGHAHYLPKNELPGACPVCRMLARIAMMEQLEPLGICKRLQKLWGRIRGFARKNPEVA